MFFQVDDKWWSNRKVVDMIDEQGFAKAAQAGFLWVMAGSHCRGSGLDGVLTTARISRLAGGQAPQEATEAAQLLVQYGLWHTAGHTCEKCPPVEEGSYLFHQWFQFKYATAAQEREATARQKELRDTAIVEAVWARDTDTSGVAHCRYCAKVVRPPERGRHGGRRRGDDIGQLDHVDPTKAIGATNIVVSCADCNQRKAQRTPQQAGMKLVPPPERPSSDQVRDQVAIKTGSSSEVSPARACPRGGAGGVGNGVGVGVEVGVPAGPGVRNLPDPRPQGQAGPVPDVAVPSFLGSPWKDHHGPPPPDDLIEQATCHEHQLPRPCRRCATLSVVRTAAIAWPSDPQQPDAPPARPRSRRRGRRGGRPRKPQGES